MEWLDKKTYGTTMSSSVEAPVLYLQFLKEMNYPNINDPSTCPWCYEQRNLCRFHMAGDCGFEDHIALYCSLGIQYKESSSRSLSSSGTCTMTQMLDLPMYLIWWQELGGCSIQFSVLFLLLFFVIFGNTQHSLCPTSRCFVFAAHEWIFLEALNHFFPSKKMSLRQMSFDS